MNTISRPNRDMNLLNPMFRKKVDIFLSEAKKKWHNIMVFEWWRSNERQRWLYAQWRTRPGRVVTRTLQSKHLVGNAVDIVFVVSGKPSRQWDYDWLIRIWNSLGMRNLKPRETCHFEDNGSPLTIGSTDTVNRPHIEQPTLSIPQVLRQPTITITQSSKPITISPHNILTSIPTKTSTTPLVLSTEWARTMFRQLFIQENPQGSSIFSNPDAAFKQCIDSSWNLKTEEFFWLMMTWLERMKKVLQVDDAKLAEAISSISK